jgi:hypothetical protein
MEFNIQFALHKSSTAHVAEASGSALLGASWEVLLASRNDIKADLIDRQRSAIGLNRSRGRALRQAARRSYNELGPPV